MIFESSLYEASPDDLLAILQKHTQQTQTLMLIGHNPGLDQLLCYLSKDTPPCDQNGKLMTTAAISVLGYDDNCNDFFAQRQAWLECLVRPKELSNEIHSINNRR